MPNLSTTINIQYGNGKTVSKTKQTYYEESFITDKVLSSTENGVELIGFDQSAFLSGKLKEAKTLLICNNGWTGVELSIGMSSWTAGTPDASAAGGQQIKHILFPGESKFYSNGRFIDYLTSPSSACNGDGNNLDNTLLSAINSGNLYKDSGADIDTATSATVTSDATLTTLNLENGHSNYFEVGDLINVGEEIMEVTAIGTGADLANSTLTVIRGVKGSTATGHSDDSAINFPFFNAYHDYAKSLIGSSQLGCTDARGRYKCNNFFGFARNIGASATTGVSGLVPGTLAFVFYTKAYHEIEFGNPIDSNTSSGLTSSTAYSFDITVADSGADTIVFTTGSNVNFGGVNGVISKINQALKTAYQTNAGFLEGYVVSCSIINGKLRFTDHSNLHPHDGTNGSQVLIEDSSDTGTGADLLTGSVGIFPNDTALPGVVDAKLPLDTITDSRTGLETSNDSVFMIDDGYGNLMYPAGPNATRVGKINYITGAVDFTIPGKPFAEFGINGHYDSVFSGRILSGSLQSANHIYTVFGRSINNKINAKVAIYAFR